MIAEDYILIPHQIPGRDIRRRVEIIAPLPDPEVEERSDSNLLGIAARLILFGILDQDHVLQDLDRDRETGIERDK